MTTYRIYKLTNAINNDIYIGRTSVQLNNRLCKHQSQSQDESRTSKIYKTMRELGKNNFNIVLLKEYENIDLATARKIEGKYIRKYKERYTKGGVLNKNIECRTSKEYHGDNKDKLSEDKKEYYKKNRDKLLEYHREYYANNRDKCLEKNHTQYEKNREKMLEQQKEYKKKNMKAISEKRGIKLVCEKCGIICSKRNMSTHKKSQHCINF